MIKKIMLCAISLSSLASLSLNARDILLEVKGAGFIPTSHLYKKIYHSSGIFGAELTFSMHRSIYGWVSVDGLRKHGFSINGHTPTRVTYIPVGLGLKCFNEFCYGDWYVGLGILAAHIRTSDSSPSVAPCYSKWGVGGIAKIGAIVDICNSMFVDIFFNYSFVKARNDNTNGNTVIPHRAKVNAAILGLGLGYRF